VWRTSAAVTAETTGSKGSCGGVGVGLGFVEGLGRAGFVLDVVDPGVAMVVDGALGVRVGRGASVTVGLAPGPLAVAEDAGVVGSSACGGLPVAQPPAASTPTSQTIAIDGGLVARGHAARDPATAALVEQRRLMAGSLVSETGGNDPASWKTRRCRQRVANLTGSKPAPRRLLDLSLVTEYDDAIRLTPGAGPDERHGTFHEGWMIGNAVNGGVVMAAGVAALGQHLAADVRETTRHRDPVALSAYFLTASAPGPFTATTEIVRTGRSLSTGELRITQPGPDGTAVERVRGIGSFGDLDGVELSRQAEAPDLPPPGRCLSADDAPPEFLKHSKFLDRVDLRLDPDTVGWAMGKPSMRGVIRGWLRLRDHREPDTTMLVLALDAFPPVAFDLGLFGWTPTLEFTAHIRRRPAPGWLRVALSTENLGGGRMEEDATIWDSEGNLVAQSRQLCGVRQPPA
jgi:acyl-CoA thioesterase